MPAHSAYPQPDCPSCEALARSAGYESVTEYLQQKERAEVTVLSLSDRKKMAA